MQLLSALDQMVGLLWISLLVSGVLVAGGIAIHGTGQMAARLYRGASGRWRFRDVFRKLGRAFLRLS
jgi:hypothetical protein